jgi:hypothetical protein
MSTSISRRTSLPATVPRRDVIVFLVATFAAVWVAALPLWLAGGDVRDTAPNRSS